LKSFLITKVAARRLSELMPMAPRLYTPIDIHPVEERHVGVDVEVQGAPEALDQGDRPFPGIPAGKPSPLDQARNSASVDNTERCAHDGRAAREQQP
jgi:hypothetical protein